MRRGSFLGPGEVADGADKSSGRTGVSAIATVGEAQFPPEINPFDRNEDDFSSRNLIMGKARADQRDTDTGDDKTFDHAYAGEFHADLELRAIGAKQFVHELARISGFGDQERLFGDVIDRDMLLPCQRIPGSNHQHELVTKDGVGFQAGRFYRQGDDTDVNRTVLQLLDDFVTEVAIDTDVDFGIKAAVFSEHFGENVEAGGFVGADGESATRGDALISDGEQRLLAQLLHALGISEQYSAGGREADDFAGAVEELVAVFLLKLADLCANGRLRTKNFLPGTRKTSELGDLQEGD